MCSSTELEKAVIFQGAIRCNCHEWLYPKVIYKFVGRLSSALSSPTPPPKEYKPLLLEICTHDTFFLDCRVSGLFSHRRGVLFFLTCRFALNTFWLVAQHSKQKSTRNQLKQTVKLTVNYFIQAFVNSSLVRDAIRFHSNEVALQRASDWLLSTRQATTNQKHHNVSHSQFFVFDFSPSDSVRKQATPSQSHFTSSGPSFYLGLGRNNAK